MSHEPAQRISARVQSFEARFSGWPTWKKLAVFGPIVVIGMALMVAALDVVAIGVFNIHGHH